MAEKTNRQEKITPSLDKNPFKWVDLGLVEANPDQPRRFFDPEALRELKISIENHGILLPLLVEQKGKKYRVLSGERRLQAARELKLSTVPVIVREVSEREAFEIALSENLQREGLTPLEEALAYQRLIKEFGLTQEQVAGALGKSRSLVANQVRLLKLPEEMQTALHEGKLSVGHAKILLGVGDALGQYRLFWMILEKDLSVKEAKTLSDSLADPEKKREGKEKDAFLSTWEDKFLHLLGSRVSIRGSSQKGQLVISYASSAEFKTICSFFEQNSNLD
jgi:ParB family chromosome partitioning protein